MNKDDTLFDGFDENFDFAEEDAQSVEESVKPKVEDTKNEPVKKEVSKVVNLDSKSKKKVAQAALTPSQIGALSASGVAKLITIYKEMNDLFVERDDVIKDMLRAVAIGVHVFLYGPPGTGKSSLTYEICDRIIGGNYFQWMLNRTSDPSEILGPFSLNAMENDKFLRKVTGKLPEAHVAFIDETWKANEPILNILLPVLNEKIFYNDGKANDIPLISVFGASNEFPEETALMALYDRFLFRENVEYIKDPGNVVKMQTMCLNSKSNASPNANKTTITIEELTAIKETAKNVTANKGILNTLSKLYITLSNKGIVISDRRKNECLKVLQGNAVFYNRKTITSDDFGALKNVLWNELKEIPIVEEELTKLINPFDNKVNDILKKFDQIKQNIDKTQDDTDKTTMVVEAKPHIQGFISKLDTIIKEAAKTGKDITKYQKQRDAVSGYYENILKQTLGLNLSSGETMEGMQF